MRKRHALLMSGVSQGRALPFAMLTYLHYQRPMHALPADPIGSRPPAFSLLRRQHQHAFI